jgi:hypothetical protein
MADADPERLALGHAYDRLFPLDPDAPVGSPHVIRTGEPELTPEIPEEFLAAAAHDDEEYGRLQHRRGPVVRGLIGDVCGKGAEPQPRDDIAVLALRER